MVHDEQQLSNVHMQVPHVCGDCEVMMQTDRYVSMAADVMSDYWLWVSSVNDRSKAFFASWHAGSIPETVAPVVPGISVGCLGLPQQH